MEWIKNLFNIKQFPKDVANLRDNVTSISGELSIVKEELKAIRNFIETKQEPAYKPMTNDIEEQGKQDVDIDETFKIPLVNGETKVRFEDEPEGNARTIKIF